MDILNIIFRSFVSLVVLFLVTRLMGKKQVSQLSMFDYVIGISIGNFAAEVSIDLDIDLLYGSIAVIVFGVVAYLISIVTMKSILLRRFFMGTPTILIKHGEIMLDGLKKVHFDINDLLEECRSNGYFDISEINYAIMEANGKLSILPFSKNKPATNKNMDIKTKENGLFANIIIDGKVMLNNLENMNKDEKWLLNIIKVKGYKLSDIILSTLDENDNVQFYLKNPKEVKNVLE